MLFQVSSIKRLSWRSALALFFYLSSLFAFLIGVSVTERPSIVDDHFLVKAYYSLSLFVVGGIDLGTPVGGPEFGRVLLWIAYFGAPILAASTLIETFFRAIARENWQIRSIKNHIVITGAGELTLSYLRVFRYYHKRVPVVVVCPDMDETTQEELKETFGAIVMVGDITHEFVLRRLRLQHARKVLLFEENNLRSFEAASKIIQAAPELGRKIIIHCSNLRFMRAMETTRVSQLCQTFNNYHLAAAALVKDKLVHRFDETSPKDVVVLAGFGRFGQTILEELQKQALAEIQTVAIIDSDANRRVLVAEEQIEFMQNYRRELIEGDISHPEVWNQVEQLVDLGNTRPAIILGTGDEEQNLRTALWLRERYPESMIVARCNQRSHFANEVGKDHNITSISITRLIEHNIPRDWFDPESE